MKPRMDALAAQPAQVWEQTNGLPAERVPMYVRGQEDERQAVSPTRIFIFPRFYSGCDVAIFPPRSHGGQPLAT